MTEGVEQSGTTLRDYVNVLRRRRWIILQALIVVPVAALAFSLTQTKLYEAKAEVLLSRQNLAAALTGTPDQSQLLQADRIAQTQAALARVPDVARQVLRETEAPLTVEEFLDSSSVSPKTNADLLEFNVTNADPELAERLVSEYARSFVEYRRELDTRALTSARIDLEETLDELEASGERQTDLYRNLLESQQQLRTLEALQTSNVLPVQAAETAEQVQPKPVRNVILGLMLGLALGVGLAFLWEALDTRVRTAEDIAARLGLPFLGRLPAPPKKLQRKAGIVMLEDPGGVHAEPFRMLRTNLDFVRLDRNLRTLMITSAVEQEGKSTTIANLAIALARAGQNVALVDLDLRRPYLDRLFGLPGAHGVTQVALGLATLEEALVTIPITGSGPVRSDAGLSLDPAKFSGNGRGAEMDGSLRVLTSGPIPPNPGEFVATQRLEAILADLRNVADLVLVDAPPMLRVGDAMTLSARVDALIVVTRLSVVRRQMLEELRRLLDAAPAAKLGFVLTGHGAEGSYGYGYGYGYETRRERRLQMRRKRGAPA